MRRVSEKNERDERDEKKREKREEMERKWEGEREDWEEEGGRDDPQALYHQITRAKTEDGQWKNLSRKKNRKMGQ